MLLCDGEMPARHRWQLGSACRQPSVKPAGFWGCRALGHLMPGSGCTPTGHARVWVQGGPPSASKL